MSNARARWKAFSKLVRMLRKCRGFDPADLVCLRCGLRVSWLLAMGLDPWMFIVRAQLPGFKARSRTEERWKSFYRLHRLYEKSIRIEDTTPRPFYDLGLTDWVCVTQERGDHLALASKAPRFFSDAWRKLWVNRMRRMRGLAEPYANPLGI